MKRLLSLIPVFISRVTGWLPLQPKTGKVQFANVSEGDYQNGEKTYFADASATNSPGIHHLVYMQSTAGVTGSYSAADCCTLCTGPTSIPLGVSEDAPDYTGMPTQIRLLGAVKGTIRVVTDGTCTNGASVMVKGSTTTINGVATYGVCTTYTTSGTNYAIGRAVIPSDCTSAAGDVITVIPYPPCTGVSTLV